MRALFQSLRRRLAGAVESSDADLLSAYLERRDDAAFERIVHRHGPTVFGVCRRMAATPTDAEDAFQAVWLVLVRKADAVRPQAMLSNWLYGVAVNVCRKSKLAAARRWARERSAARPDDHEPPPADGLSALLDDEIHRLPDRLRAAVVACDVEGLPRSSAAHRLGWPEGTVASRLSRGRAMLAKRLLQRGVGPTAVAAGAVIPNHLYAAALAARDAVPAPAVEALASEAIRGLASRATGLIALATAACVGLATVVVISFATKPGEEAPPEPTPVARIAVAPPPRLVAEPPSPRVVANPANDIRIIATKDETLKEFFRRQRVVVAGLLEEKLTPLFTATETSKAIYVGYPAFNYDEKNRSYGTNLRIAPPPPAVVELVRERIRENTDRAQLNLIFVVDAKTPEVVHLVGYTTRNTVSFFEGKKVAPDPFSPGELVYAPDDPKK